MPWRLVRHLNLLTIFLCSCWPKRRLQWQLGIISTKKLRISDRVIPGLTQLRKTRTKTKMTTLCQRNPREALKSLLLGARARASEIQRHVGVITSAFSALALLLSPTPPPTVFIARIEDLGEKREPARRVALTRLLVLAAMMKLILISARAAPEQVCIMLRLMLRLICLTLCLLPCMSPHRRCSQHRWLPGCILQHKLQRAASVWTARFRLVPKHN